MMQKPDTGLGRQVHSGSDGAVTMVLPCRDFRPWHPALGAELLYVPSLRIVGPGGGGVVLKQFEATRMQDRLLR